ncbi:hypothetical protein C8Q74DRAFT_993589 [Fomes fomentarius]|nr:hypothetical protein C8Q74DRAFT_993589 [Fomes fomentarius]
MTQVSEGDARRILEHHGGGSVVIAEFKPFPQKSFDGFTPSAVYTIRLDDGTSYILKASPSAGPASASYAPNSLDTEHTLLRLLASQSDIPTPVVHAYDASTALVPYTYLLLSRPRGVPLSDARASGKLSPRQLTLLDLRTGAYLKRLHSLQNDWFGLPTQAQDGLYSWQEAFTPMLESLLDDAEAHVPRIELPYADVRRYLSRAIGCFLFDDCEVPSLISFTGDAHSTLVDVDLETGAGNAGEEEIRVTSFGSLGHALWGDPLLETMFLDPPSAAFVEGYGGPVILFARQKTKRVWYTLFLALMVLVQAKKQGKEDHEKVQWAGETAQTCAAALEHAPNY